MSYGVFFVCSHSHQREREQVEKDVICMFVYISVSDKNLVLRPCYDFISGVLSNSINFDFTSE